MMANFTYLLTLSLLICVVYNFCKEIFSFHQMYILVDFSSSLGNHLVFSSNELLI